MSKAKDLASGGSGKNQRRRRWLRRVWLCGPWKWRGKGEASRWRLRRLGKNAGAEAVMASRRRLGHGRWWLRGDHARSANPSGLAGVWFGLSPSSRGGEKATGGEGRGDGRADGRPMLFFPTLLENRSSDSFSYTAREARPMHHITRLSNGHSFVGSWFRPPPPRLGPKSS